MSDQTIDMTAVLDVTPVNLDRVMQGTAPAPYDPRDIDSMFRETDGVTRRTSPARGRGSRRYQRRTAIQASLRATGS
jgi:hypothetical protein